MEIIWTETAKNDLQNIFFFLKTEIPENKAQNIIIQIVNKVNILENMPLIGRKEPKFSGLKKEYRRLIESHYKIIYHTFSDNIYINRVFDSRQNPNKLFVK